MASTLPETIKTHFEALSNDLTWIQVRWLMYKKLFHHSDERLELLNESAGFFFFVLQRVLLDDVIIGTCRLADPRSTGGRKNLVLESLTNDLDAPLSSAVTSKIDQLRQHAMPLQRHRNRRLAHRNLHTALRSERSPLPTVSVETIDSALGTASEVLNMIERHFCDSETSYDYVAMHAGVDALVADLVRAQDYEVCLREGIIEPEREAVAKYRGA
jgi:hypothetical protein